MSQPAGSVKVILTRPLAALLGANGIDDCERRFDADWMVAGYHDTKMHSVVPSTSTA